MKLSLTGILNELGKSGWAGNAKDGGPHHYNKSPKTKYQHYPFSYNDFPYINRKDDLQTGEYAAELGEDPEDQKLPEALGYQKTVRGRSNAPPVHHWTRELSNVATNDPGVGVSPRNFGRQQAATFDPAKKDPINKKRSEVAQARADVKAKSAGKLGKKNPLESVGGYSQRKERDSVDYDTSQPWATGIKKNRDKRFHRSEIEKEEDFLDKDRKDITKFYEWADDDYSRSTTNRKARKNKEDLEFWEKTDKLHAFMMHDEDDFKEEDE